MTKKLSYVVVVQFIELTSVSVLFLNHKALSVIACMSSYTNLMIQKGDLAPCFIMLKVLKEKVASYNCFQLVVFS